MPAVPLRGALGLLLLTPVLVCAQPLTARDQMLYPVNPPLALPSTSSLDEEPIEPRENSWIRPVNPPRSLAATQPDVHPSSLIDPTTVRIEAVHQQDGGPDAHSLSLDVGVVSKFATKLLPENVEVRAFFFKQTPDRKILPSAMVTGTLQDTSPAPDADASTRPLWSYRLDYRPSKDEPYAGYIVGIYQDGTLRDSRASSPELAAKNPLALRIPHPSDAPNVEAENLARRIIALLEVTYSTRAAQTADFTAKNLARAQELLQQLVTRHPHWRPVWVQQFQQAIKELTP